MKKGQSIKLLHKFNILVADLLKFPNVAASKCKVLSFLVKKQGCFKTLGHVLCPKRLTSSYFYGSFYDKKYPYHHCRLKGFLCHGFLCFTSPVVLSRVGFHKVLGPDVIWRHFTAHSPVPF